MPDYLKIFFVFLVISFFAVSCMQANEPPVKETGLAPDFSLQDLSQNTFNLSSYRDKQPVILFFWTTWCHFCRKELKMLKDIYPQLQKDGSELLAISVGEPAYKVDNFAKGYALNFKVLLDRYATVADAYNVLGVPTYVLINKKGNIVFRGNYFPKEKYKELIYEW
jgi:peroxiredoxin